MAVKEVDLQRIGTRIRKARKKKKLTQDQLAEKIHKSVAYISRLENGRGKPSLDMLVELMDALDMTPNEIFCGVTESTKPMLLKETEWLQEKCPREVIVMYNQWLESYLSTHSVVLSGPHSTHKKE